MNNSQTPPSPCTPPRKHYLWRHESSKCITSPSPSEGPGYCSTPSSSKNSSSKKICATVHERFTPPKYKLSKSPSARCRNQVKELSSHRSSEESKLNTLEKFSNQASCSKPLVSKTISSAVTSQTVTVDLDFPLGGWDEGSSSDDSSGGLEIVETENECKSSPNHANRKRKLSEVFEEDNPIISGMGEEIERQLEAKAERNRLTVPNVKNILRSVITNPYVQAMVRRSIRSGEVAISGDIDEISFEPRITRAKAKLLCDGDTEGTWPKMSNVTFAGTPLRPSQSSECQALISEELNDDSEDDEEYKPGEDDYEDLDRDGSERGSERDSSIEQSPASFVELDTESCPSTPVPSPRPHIIDSATQTNWSEDGVFKVPLVPVEPQLDHSKDENIALRTRSKLPLNEIPLEEIEQAFIPPDITPDLYDTACDNADWQEFLKEFMQPMRPDPEVPNHDDDEEDPEYNVLAEEEIIDQEELRMDKAVKISKRELNELMKELAELNDNLSSDDEEKETVKDSTDNSKTISPGNSNIMSCNDDMSDFLDAYMSLGTLTPLNTHRAPSQSSRSPSTPTLHTPVPPISSPCLRTPGTAKKVLHSDLTPIIDNYSALPVNGKGLPGNSSGKKQSFSHTPGKLNGVPYVSCASYSTFSPGKVDHEFDSTVLLSEVKPMETLKGDKAYCNSVVQISSPGIGTLFQIPLNNEGKCNETEGGLDQTFATESINKSWRDLNAQPNENISSAQVDDLNLSNSVSGSSLINDPVEELSGLMLFKPKENVCLSPDGDVIIDNTILLSAIQRRVLDQQMRQHVQFLTQHFLQTFQHPLYGNYAAACKEKLVTLKSLGKNRGRSAFKAENLDPALEVINSWEKKLASEEGPAILSFFEQQHSIAEKMNKYRRKFDQKLPPQLMKLMGDSTAFVYPHLLPHSSFKTFNIVKYRIIPSEDQLLVMGLEEFTNFIKENNPKEKRWLTVALEYITQYILVGRRPKSLSTHLRRRKSKKEDGPIKYYYQHKCAPPTSHIVRPFHKEKMLKLKDQPHNVLPLSWRNFFYPAHDER